MDNGIISKFQIHELNYCWRKCIRRY